MADIFREVDEELRQENVQKLWRKYGALVIAAAAAIILATAGYTIWVRYSESRNRAATEAYAAALAAEDRASALGAVAAEYGGPHATLARLHEAAAQAEAGNIDAAVALLRQVAQDGNEVPSVRDLATLLGVLYRVDSADPAALQTELAPLTVDTNPLRFSARELSATLALRAGDTAKAREILTQLAADTAAPAGVQGRAAELAAALAE